MDLLVVFQSLIGINLSLINVKLPHISSDLFVSIPHRDLSKFASLDTGYHSLCLDLFNG